MPRKRVATPCRLRIGFNWPGTFSRLAIHMGAIIAWLNAGLPLPQLVVATSAGAILGACVISFDRTVVRHVAHIIRHLRSNQIFRLSAGLKKVGMLLMSATAVLIASGIMALAVKGPDPMEKWGAVAIFALGIGVCSWMIRFRVIPTFFACPSPLDNTPLRELMFAERVAEIAFQAKAELRILAADVAAPGVLVYSNHEPRMCDPENRLHIEHFVDGGILGTSALPGRFNLRIVAGKMPRDGEVWTDYPVHQFKGEVDVVFRFDYWPPLMSGMVPKHWLSDLFRCFDVMRDKNTREKMARYELERESDPTLPKVVNIRASEKLPRSIPDLAVYSFKPGQLWRMMKFGREIIRENLPMIRRELGLDEGHAPAA